MQPLLDEPIRELWLAATRAANTGRLGTLMPLPAAEVLPDHVYAPRRELLKIAALDDDAFAAAVVNTPYYRAQESKRGRDAALAKCRSFRALLGKMRTPVYNIGTAPVVLYDGARVIRRLDGTHRAAVARFLGHDTILCVAITPDEYRAFQAPRLADAAVQDVLAADIAAFGKWYQAIEVLPGLWTRPPAPDKTGPILRMLPPLVGCSVLDVGCNAGLYTLSAAACGARRAIGIDRRPAEIAQADWLARVWSVARPETAAAAFVCADIFGRLDLLAKCDVLIAACVLYHLGHGLHPFMEAVKASPVQRIIVQGNLGRARKSPASEVEQVIRQGVSRSTPARLIFGLPQFKSLMAMYGFRPVSETQGTFPVGVYERGQ